MICSLLLLMVAFFFSDKMADLNVEAIGYLHGRHGSQLSIAHVDFIVCIYYGYPYIEV